MNEFSMARPADGPQLPAGRACDMIAVSSIPKSADDRTPKDDRRDARGLLEAVTFPTSHCRARCRRQGRRSPPRCRCAPPMSRCPPISNSSSSSLTSGRRVGHNVFGCKTEGFCRGVSAKSDALQFLKNPSTPFANKYNSVTGQIPSVEKPIGFAGRVQELKLDASWFFSSSCKAP